MMASRFLTTLVLKGTEIQGNEQQGMELITSPKYLLCRINMDLCVGILIPSKETRLTSGLSMFWVTKEERSTMARPSLKDPLHSILYINTNLCLLYK